MDRSVERYNKLLLFHYTVILCSATGILGQTTLQVAWMVPFSSYYKNAFVYNASSSVAALALGIETVYNQSILPGYVFNVTPIDTKCRSTESIGALADVLTQLKIDVVIGIPCTKLNNVIELLYYKKIPFFNWYSEEEDTDLSGMYTRLFAPDYSVVVTTYFFILKHTPWDRFVIVCSDSATYKSVTNVLNLYFKGPNSSLLHVYDDMRINAHAWEIDRTFETIKKEARIIVLIVPREELRNYMLRAHHLGMTNGEYKFIFADTKIEDETFLKGKQLWQTGDEFDSLTREAFRHVIYIVGKMDFQNISIWENAALEAYNCVFSGRPDIPAPTEPDRFSGLLHDAIVLYAKALNRSLESGGNKSVTGMALEVTFKGITGDVASYGRLGRITDTSLYEIRNSSEFEKIFGIDLIIVNDSVKTLYWVTYDHPNTDYPPDIPLCGFSNEKCPNSPMTGKDENNLPLVISVCTSMSVILIAALIVWRWQRERNLLKMSWKIEYSDLNFNHRSAKMKSSLSVAGGDQNRFACNLNQSKDLRSRASSAQSSKGSLGFGQIFTNVAIWQGEIVAVKYTSLKRISVDRVFLSQMKNLNEMKHENLVKFIGVCLSPEKICSIWEYCNKGSIQDIIENESIRLDAMFKFSIATDVCRGLEYIHNNKILRCHGNLRSSKCVIDSRWVCKLTDFGIERVHPATEAQQSIEEHAFYTKLFWTAPEILRKVIQKKEIERTCSSDVYSLGIIIMELVCRSEPYSCYPNLNPKEIILKIAKSTNNDNIFRPFISADAIDPECNGIDIVRIIKDCWTENPYSRPTVKNVLKCILKISPFKKVSVVDNMILMMEKYANDLENIVCERTQQLEDEKMKTESLLYRMLPRKIADDLKLGNSIQAEAYESVTIYFSDIVQFTNIASESTPFQIVCLLNALYTLFDEIISGYDVYKVETIGDAYMIVSGLPEENGNFHVREIARVSIKILESVLTFKLPHKVNEQLRIRIGLHTGPVVAGVVGLTMPRYCLFGDTVNTASRMESNGEPLRIHISPETNEALSYFPNFLIEERGIVPIKGKGCMHTYWLNGELGEQSDEEKDQESLMAEEFA